MPPSTCLSVSTTLLSLSLNRSVAPDSKAPSPCLSVTTTALSPLSSAQISRTCGSFQPPCARDELSVVVKSIPSVPGVLLDDNDARLGDAILLILDIPFREASGDSTVPIITTLQKGNKSFTKIGSYATDFSCRVVFLHGTASARMRACVHQCVR